MSVKLTFLGGADTVTGSRTLLTYRGRHWLIDCGLFQGSKPIRERNWQPMVPAAATIEGILLTHAHLDHSGYLPKICNEGFKGRIYATAGTTDLCHILLRDAAKLEEEAADYANKTKYSHHNPALPLFTLEDAERALTRFTPCQRQEWITLSEGLSVRFVRAGHIIGASLVQINVETPTGQRILTFSGDLGNSRCHLLRPPDQVMDTDVLVLESTYGDRLQPRTSGLDALGEAIRRGVARAGVIVIPAFAVGRAQEITYMLRLLEDRKEIPKIPVILDSPMATEAMGICLRHPEDQVLGSAFHSTQDPFHPEHFEVSVSADDSMESCMRDGPIIVISASGMLNGGRILHHLKRRLPSEKNMVIFTGYQAEGTKGRYLQDQNARSSTIRIHHKEVPIEAEIVTLDHLSSHADQADLLEYLNRMRQLPTHLFLNHGNPDAQRALASKIKERFGIDAQPVNDTPSIQLWGRAG